jgi:hypothetical protein
LDKGKPNSSLLVPFPTVEQSGNVRLGRWQRLRASKLHGGILQAFCVCELMQAAF